MVFVLLAEKLFIHITWPVEVLRLLLRQPRHRSGKLAPVAIRECIEQEPHIRVNPQFEHDHLINVWIFEGNQFGPSIIELPTYRYKEGGWRVDAFAEEIILYRWNYLRSDVLQNFVFVIVFGNGL
jgi:hypothetical protein